MKIKIIYYLISPLPHSADSTPTVTFCNSISKVYKYFLLGSNNFFKTHIEDGKLADNGMKFVYPILSKEDYIKEK